MPEVSPVAEELSLTPELREVAIAALNSYRNAPVRPNGQTLIQHSAELDQKRHRVIDQILRPLLTGYLSNSISSTDFKRRVDSCNKQNNHWGFRGVKGQMFFNMLMNTAEDSSGLDAQLKAAIRQPATEDEAKASLQNFAVYTDRIGQQFVDTGGDARSKPKVGSIPFFVSYFWQIQQPEIWPVYYTNSVQVIESMNLWEETGEAGADYVSYKCLHERLARLFSEVAGRPFSLYDVEHVFWFRGGMQLGGATRETEQNADPGVTTSINVVTPEQPPASDAEGIPDSYLPPIVSILPRLSINDAMLQQAARRAGTTLERTFEKSINAALTMLGYETHLLGQGMGRVPDGQAIATDESYALLWDAKARSSGYSMGTDDRIIRQYIDTQSRTLKRGRGIRNIYYLIISSVSVVLRPLP